MSTNFDDEDDDLPEMVGSSKYNPSEYELRIDHLLDAHIEDLIIKITTFDGDIIRGTIPFVYAHEVRVAIHNEENITEKTLPISEIRFTEIERLRKPKKG